MYQALKIVFVLFIFSSGFAFTENEEKPSQTFVHLSPSNLPSKWPLFFKGDAKILKDRKVILEKSLTFESASISETNQEQIVKLKDEILANFNKLLSITSQEMPSSFSAPSIKDKYLVSDILSIFRKVRKTEIELHVFQEKIEEQTKLIDQLQDQIGKFLLEYGDTSDRSEDKLIIGLHLLEARSTQEIISRQLDFSRLHYRFTKDKLTDLKDELKFAINHPASTQKELDQYLIVIPEKENKFKEAQNQLSQLEAKQLISTHTSDNENDDLEMQRQSVLILEAKTKSAIANCDLLMNLLSASYSQLLLSPKNSEQGELKERIKTWENELVKYKHELPLWQSKSRRYFQRASELLTLNHIDESVEQQRLQKLRSEIVTLSQNNLLLLQRLTNDIDDNLFLVKLIQGNLIQYEKDVIRFSKEIGSFFWSIFVMSYEWSFQALFYIGHNPVTILSLIQFFLILIAFFWLSRLVLGGMKRFAATRKGIQKSLVYRINRLLHYLILFLGLIIALTSIGFDFSNFLLVAGALGVGLGFGLQSIFNNFLSGIIILFESYLKVGDYIEFEKGEMRGEIREINFRSSIITTNDGVDVVVPNSELLNNRIVNWTLRDPYRRVSVPFSVAYGTDKEKLEEIIIEASKKVPLTLNKIGVPGPRMYLSKFGDNALEFELVVWVDERATRRTRNTASTYLWAIEKALYENNIVIPFPQRVLHVKQVLDKNNVKDVASEFRSEKKNRPNEDPDIKN